MVAIRARFDGKVIVPEEPVDLPKDRVFIVHVEASVPGRPGPEPGASLDYIAENAIDDPAFPEDGSYQHDHYVHGSPKRPWPTR